MKFPELPAANGDDSRLMRVAALSVIGVVVVGALYYGRDVMIPAAIAILLAFILGPAVTWVRRLLPLSLAVALVVLSAAVIIGLLTALITAQLADVANSLTTYQANLAQKIRDIRGLSEGGGLLSRFMAMLASLGSDIGATPGAASAQLVRLETGASGFEGMLVLLGPLLHPILTIGIVGILVIFILMDRDHLSDQLVRLFGANDVYATSAAIEDAGRRVARVLTLQVMTNAGFATMVGGGLFALGLPNAVLWGLLAGGLRFIPYVGTALGALLPTLVAFAVMPGWSQPLLVLGWVVLCDIIVGQFIEPLWFGGSTGVTPLALIMSAIFWGALWGPIGLLLSTPLAICLLVLGMHVPHLGFLRILIGASPVLEPYQQIYRRLIRKAVVDAATVALSEIEEKGRERGLDAGMGRMVALAEADRARDRLTTAQADAIAEGTDEVLEIIAADTAEGAEAVVAGSAAASADVQFRCIGGRGSVDAAAASVIAFALREAGAKAASRRRGDKAAEVETDAATILDLICYASHPSESIRRYTSRKLALGRDSRRTLHLIIDHDASAPASPAGAAGDILVGDIAALSRLAMQEAVALQAALKTP